MAIILASASPRRQQLLRQMGLTFTVKIADIEETISPRDLPRETVQRLSSQKAAAVAAQCDAHDVIIAADTIVVLDEKILGKPKDAADAKRTLRMLSGRSHHVLTAFTVVQGERTYTGIDDSAVQFRELTDGEIDDYVATGEPLDKAGSYGVQGEGGRLIEAIHGDYYNVMGLPIGHLASILHRFGVHITGENN